MTITATEFRLPDVGEGLTEAEILEWHVAVGDVVDVNDTLVDVETAKSVVELPSPVAGTVSAIHVEAGTTVAVGVVLVTIGGAPAVLDEPEPAPPAAEAAPVAVAEPEPALPAEPQEPSDAEKPVGDTPLVLVGTGPSAAGDRRRRLPPRDSLATEAVEISPAVSVEKRTPVKGVRKAIAAAMVESAFTAPHVTVWLTIDVTATMDLCARLRSDRAWSQVRITPLVLVARALLLAVRRHPEVNATWDEGAQEIVQFPHVNLGIAAATPRGLIVPNIKSADDLDLRGLAIAIGDLVTTARSGRTTPEQQARGTISITNIGALGVDAGTPILNPGEAAILAFGAVREQPWVVDGAIVPRRITTLALSFDHRLVDGELGAAVLTDVARILQDPGETLLLA